MSSVQYTPEQADVLDHVIENDGITLVQAGAGCGKTFLARRIVAELKIKSGIYTAFNKAIVEEGVQKFRGTPMECKTLHALAYAYVRPKTDIKIFSYKCITEKISYTEKRKIIDGLDAFFVSNSTDMYEYFENLFKDHIRKDYMVKIATGYINGMLEETVAPTFNFLLKYLHLMLVEGTVKIKTDLVILDEINDITAVALEIFKLIDAPKKIGLGETHQAIYEFLNLVNGFEKLNDEAKTMRLTQSYRCSEDVAARIEKKMKSVMDKNFSFKGTNSPVRNGQTLYCTLTNAMIVDKIQQRLEEGKSFTLLRKPADIFAAPLAVLSASQGKRPYQSKYEFLLDEYEEFHKQKKHKTYFSFLLELVDDDEIHNAVKLLQRLAADGINLYNVYKEAKNIKPDKNYTISTVFTAKGLEYETVYIADDLNRKFSLACNGELEDDSDTITAMRCYYVATSRCGVYLQNSLI